MARKTDDPLLPLWKSAVAGDDEAMEELARRVRGWTVKEAHRYEVKYSNAVSADDLISAAYAKFLPVVRAYNPDRGASFMGYYMAAAGRAMVDVFNTHQKHDNLIRNAEAAKSEETFDDDAEHARECSAVNTALQWISPFERRLLEAVSGTRGMPRTLPEVARFLRLSENDAKGMFARLTKRVEKHIRSQTRRGPAPDPVLSEIVDYARNRRHQGVKWSVICTEAHQKFGRLYSVRILKMHVHKRGRRQKDS